MKIARVALDVPLEESFDFLVPDGLDPGVGNLVVVPFGRTAKLGVVVERASQSDVAPGRLRALERVVADVAPLS